LKKLTRKAVGLEALTFKRCRKAQHICKLPEQPSLPSKPTGEPLCQELDLS